MYVAGGHGTNTLAYSYDGLTWIGLGSTIFTSVVLGVSWNGTRWIAVGSSINTIAYSDNGINWTGIGTTVFTGQGYGVSWNGTIWVAVGYGSNTIAYSSDCWLLNIDCRRRIEI